MTSFTINLKNEKLALYNRLSKLIIFILFIFFCYLAIFAADSSARIKSTGTALLLLLVFGLERRFSNTKYRFSHRPFFMVIILGWITLGYYWLAALTLLFDIFAAITTRPMAISFSAGTINYPSFPVKHIQWSELNQVILKDGLLTIDFKTNKLIQQMIDELNSPVDEKEFNDFCRQQLNT